jgi:PPOX class probable F420-dependent enzyme
MQAAGNASAFEGERYLNLETYRKSGVSVRTPVWFAIAPDTQPSDAPKLYVYSTTTSGKAKRIRRSSVVKVAPCNMRGSVTGQWVDGRAEIVTGDDFDRGMRLLDRKYRPWKQVLGLLSRLFSPNQRVVIAIRLI